MPSKRNDGNVLVTREHVQGFQHVFHNNIKLEEVVEDAVWREKEGRLRYCHLEDGERHLVDAVLRGVQPLSKMPRLNSRVVRIFISSTFTDMQQERNALMATIFPKLRAFCRERYGVEFQVVDMRWGVPSAARDDHSAVDLCLQEIKNCQQNSIGPCFVVFLGQKYGQRMLPAKIPMNHYEPIRKCLKQIERNVALLDTWYLKDSNAQPGVYILQSISSILGDDQKDWNKICEELDTMLLDGAEMCVKNGDIEEEVYQRLKYSVTELEVLEGVMNTSETKPEKNCLCFIRDIIDLKDFLDTRNASKYVDMIEDKMEILSDKEDAIETLREEKITSLLNDENVYRKQVKWEDPEGIDKQRHCDYLENLCGYFFSRVRDMITMNIDLKRQMDTDFLYEDVVQHWELCKSKCDIFVGRDAILNQIEQYIVNVTNKALILHGESGNGKTSIMAKAASLVNTWLDSQNKTLQRTVILRFCGTSPATSNISQLLRGLCHQIAYATDKYRSQIPEDYKDVKKYFTDLVVNGESGGMTIIFLDAIDQLSPDDSAYKLDWLPAKISNNVKIILSTLPSEGGILSRLQSKITDQNFHIEVGELSANNCNEIIHFWLTDAKRILSFNQWKLVKEAFTHCSVPLFTKLTFEEVVQWKSYSHVDGSTLALCVGDCIHKLFDRLEERHGKVMVAHSLAYITASRGGISESELEDMLSLDDKVLNSVFVFWEPPIRRVPPNLWSRIRHDISQYLTERETDDTDVIFWYHRQFIEIAQSRYLSKPDQISYIHGVMAEYFLGVWSGMKKKPFTYEPFLMQRMNIKSKHAAAVRYVPEQPLVFTTFNTRERFNLRTLNQVPYHLVKAGLKHILEQEVFFDYKWIHTKLRACSVQEVIADFNLVDERDVNLVGDALRMAESALALDPNVLGPELTGRLLPHAGNYVNIQKLLYECDNNALHKCPFVPVWQVYTTPGGPLQYVCEAESSINSDMDVDIIQSEETLLLTAKPFYSSHMRIWDVTQGEPKHSMNLPSGSQVHPTLNGKFINLIKNNKYLQTFRVDSGELYGEVLFGHGNIGTIAVGNRYAVISFKEAPGPCVIDIEAKCLIHKMSFHTNTVTITKDDKYLFCNSGHCITLHEFPLLERKSVVQCKDIPTKIVVAKGNLRFFVMLRNKEIQVVNINPMNRKIKISGVVRDLEMRDFDLSHTEAYLLVRAARCLYVFDAANAKLKHRIVKMPPGVFLEQLSTFVEAGFTQDDKLLVGARHTYLGVWEADTGKPVRLLQSVVSPIERMFTSSLVNKVITLLEDRTIQVWNMDNLDADVRHSNTLVKGSVVSLGMTSDGSKVIGCGASTAEAKVFSAIHGETQLNLVHSDQHGAAIKQVLISPKGRYAITRCPNRDLPPHEEPWDQIYEDKLWDLSNGELALTVTRGQFIALDPADEHVVWLKCLNYSWYDWMVTRYVAILFDNDSQESKHVQIPEGHIIGKPVITSGGRFLAFIVQKCHRLMDVSLNEVSRKYEHVLCLYSFASQWRDIKTMSIQDIWSGFKPNDTFMDLVNMTDDTLLITYGKNMSAFPVTENGTIDRSVVCPKGAMVYNVKSDNLLKRYDQYLSPESNMDGLLVSRTTSMILDDNFRLFDVVTERPPEMLSYLAHMAAPGTIRFILDGRYLVMISHNLHEILLMRRGSKYVVGKCYIHGTGRLLEVGEDDRTVLVGCADGRVLMFMVVIESPDVMVELISHLPSRANMRNIYDNGMQNGDSKALHKDVKHIVNYNHELRQLSAKTRRDHDEIDKKLPSFRAVNDVVMISQQYNKSRSRACVIQ